MHWTMVNGSIDMLGLIPDFLNEFDSRSAREQLNDAYAHGGGWQSFEGFMLNSDQLPEKWRLRYPNDPPMRIIGFTRLPQTNETVAVFEYAWIAVVASDGSYEIARMD